MRGTEPSDDLPQLDAQLRAHSLVGVERENPAIPCGRDSGVSLRRNRFPDERHRASTRRLRDANGIVRGTAVDHDDLVGPREIGNGGADLSRLVERGDDHAER